MKECKLQKIVINTSDDVETSYIFQLVFLNKSYATYDT